MKLTISYIQTMLFWEDKEANLKMLSAKISSIAEGTDLIILPEMFSTGFSMNPKQFAETMEGDSVQWMQKKAKEKNAVLIGSLIIKEASNYFNRLLVVFPDGVILHYDKKHLFTLAGEDKIYSEGKERLVFEYKGWKICPLVCYDLRFPVWSRNTEDFEVLIFIANWPERRNFAWKQLLIARAIENMCYTIGVNRVGLDGNAVNYSGDSVILDFFGNTLSNATSNTEEIKTFSILKEPMQKAQGKLQFLGDRDDFRFQ